MASTESKQSVRHSMDKSLSSEASHSLNMFQSQLPLWRCSDDVPDRMREIADETASSL